jgi:hypothetical protein
MTCQYHFSTTTYNISVKAHPCYFSFSIITHTHSWIIFVIFILNYSLCYFITHLNIFIFILPIYDTFIYFSCSIIHSAHFCPLYLFKSFCVSVLFLLFLFDNCISCLTLIVYSSKYFSSRNSYLSHFSFSFNLVNIAWLCLLCHSLHPNNSFVFFYIFQSLSKRLTYCFIKFTHFGLFKIHMFYDVVINYNFKMDVRCCGQLPITHTHT